MSSIMELIRPELSKLSALELENLPYQGSRCQSPVAPNAKIFNKWLQNRSTGESTGEE